MCGGMSCGVRCGVVCVAYFAKVRWLEDDGAQGGIISINDNEWIRSQCVVCCCVVRCCWYVVVVGCRICYLL